MIGVFLKDHRGSSPPRLVSWIGWEDMAYDHRCAAARFRFSPCWEAASEVARAHVEWSRPVLIVIVSLHATRHGRGMIVCVMQMLRIEPSGTMLRDVLDLSGSMVKRFRSRTLDSVS